MNTRRTATIASLVLAAVVEAAGWAPRLPAFALEDPWGGLHQSDALLRDHGGLLLVVSAPAAAQAQAAWASQLSATAPAGRSFVLVEDVAARARPVAALPPGGAPLVLIDRAGELRRELGVGEGNTVVLVYGRAGLLRHVETAPATPERARWAWAALLRSQEEVP